MHNLAFETPSYSMFEMKHQETDVPEKPAL